MLLERVTGPECLKCGCQDVREEGRQEIRGVKHEGDGRIEVIATRTKLRCMHCGYGWQVSTPYTPLPTPQAPLPTSSAGGAVAYYPVRCPECGSTNQRVTRTQQPVRYHKCQDCDHTFKSVEKGA